MATERRSGSRSAASSGSRWGSISQTIAQAALDVREQVPGHIAPGDVAEVNIATLQTAVNIMAGDAEKWRQANRETADHSMPYTAAVALLYGGVESRHFDDEFLFDATPAEFGWQGQRVGVGGGQPAGAGGDAVRL